MADFLTRREKLLRDLRGLPIPGDTAAKKRGRAGFAAFLSNGRKHRERNQARLRYEWLKSQLPRHIQEMFEPHEKGRTDFR